VAWRVCVRNGRSFPVQRWWAPPGCLGHIGRPRSGIPDHSARGTLYYGAFRGGPGNHLEHHLGKSARLWPLPAIFLVWPNLHLVSFRGWQSWERESYFEICDMLFSERRAVALGRLKHSRAVGRRHPLRLLSKSLGLAHLRGNLSPEQSHAAAPISTRSRVIQRPAPGA